jgi:DNA-binding response OmpR family regulator
MGRGEGLRRLLHRPRRIAGAVNGGPGTGAEHVEAHTAGRYGPVRVSPPSESEAPWILVIDDEPRITSFLGRALTTCGFRVECAHDEEEAFELVSGRRYDLILLDLLLPGGGGFDLMQRILELRPDQEIVALSALSDVDSKLRSFALGASDYVTKPFVVSELVARIHTRLRRSGSSGGAYSAGEDVTLDPQRHVVSWNGDSVHLSGREYLLFEYLRRRRGEVCTRQELHEAVWGYSFDPGTNVVDVYVGRLRSKLGRDIIETVRNVGYGYGASPPRT